MTYTDIVIVDGDDANRAMLCRALTGIGFLPDRALGALKTDAYDVVPTPIEADLLQQVIQEPAGRADRHPHRQRYTPEVRLHEIRCTPQHALHIGPKPHVSAR
jgi:hypothetical protein